MFENLTMREIQQLIYNRTTLKEKKTYLQPTEEQQVALERRRKVEQKLLEKKLQDELKEVWE